MSNNYEATSEGLFKDGKKIIPEFGNEEHIKALRKYEKRAEALNGEGLELEHISWEVTVGFKCLCGCHVSESKEDIGDMDVSNFHNETVTCDKCRTEYIFGENEESDLVVKIKES